MTDPASSNGRPPKLHKIDPAKLKLRDLTEIEAQLGRRLGREFMSGDLGMDTMQALVWIELRRSDPSFTFTQAGEYDLESLVVAFEGDDQDDEAVGPDPTGGPSGKPSGEPSSRPSLRSATSGG